MPVAQDQRALHFVYVVIAPVLGVGGSRPQSHSQPLCPIPHPTPHTGGLPRKPQVPLEDGRAASNIKGLTDHTSPRESPSIGNSRTSQI